MLRSRKLVLVALALGLLALQPNKPAKAESVLPARNSDAAGVRVAVTPKTVSAGAATWEFAVVMDTHTKPLNDDMARAAVLIDDAGRRHEPRAWQGDPPGGHHRKGMLQFAAPAGQPVSIELQISGIGGSGIRSFRWKLK